MEVEVGWHLDPFGLHEHRYFSRGKPTKLVRDDGRESYDEPPADAPHVDAIAADSLRAVPASARTPTQVASMSPKASGPPQASVPPPPKGVPPRRRRGIVLAVGVIALIVVVGVAYAVIADGSKTPHAVTTGARARASEPTTVRARGLRIRSQPPSDPLPRGPLRCARRNSFRRASAIPPCAASWRPDRRA